MLRCIRCGACMNHCPVYHAVGGHAYGWVYPGPMGAVLTPSLIGVDKAGHLPNASTFCGRCESVCPMQIPLPKMMRHWREREFERALNPATAALRAEGSGPSSRRRPALYRPSRAIGMRLLVAAWAGASGAFPALPLAGGWTRHRELPAPEGAHLHAASVASATGAAMSARDAILGKVRAALKARRGDEARRRKVMARLRKAPRGVIPARGQLPPRRADRRCSAQMAEKLFATRRAAAAARRRAEGGGRLSAGTQPAGRDPHGRRSAAGGDALGGHARA